MSLCKNQVYILMGNKHWFCLRILYNITKRNCSLHDSSNSHCSSLSICITLALYVWIPFTYHACSTPLDFLQYIFVTYQMWIPDCSSIFKFLVVLDWNRLFLLTEWMKFSKFCINKASVWFALEVINWICWCHFKLFYLNTYDGQQKIKCDCVFCKMRISYFV